MMEQSYSLTLGDDLEHDWAKALLRFLEHWVGTSRNDIDGALNNSISQVLEILKSYGHPLTQREMANIRIRILTIGIEISKSPTEADMSLYAKFEQAFLMELGAAEIW